MGSLLGDWPSYDPHNFSQLRPADPSAQPSKLTPVTYHPTHNRTLPPPDQGQKGRNMLYSFRALTDAVPTQIRIGPGFSGTLIVIQACAILLIADFLWTIDGFTLKIYAT
ncbi:uncharacterized protein [Elaeis guineensis]|uniref:Uncharacterized protein LOC105054202 isoform X2 n=1 Tax=Elaeis guineensis var. tenera TaxID=51953 RepID=A0A6J0PP06_ELAGV|nr:uncharacterized protein LOC105054202 isoform X2 [Elaeis guineensis]